MAGALAGFNVTFTKSMFAIIGEIVENEGFGGILTTWITYICGFTLLATFVAQTLLVTKGLEKCNALVVMPCQAVAEAQFSAFGGILYFQDYKKFVTWSAALFILGNLMAAVAVVVNVWLR